jgi:N-acetylmuramic acid 6-phosphate etherase
MTMINKTESLDPAYAELDRFPIERLVDAFVADQLNAVAAVQAARASLAAAVAAAVPRIAAGGRLIYVGAGTSGRLGMLDAVELSPTFSWPRERAIALVAGGAAAIAEAVEGAEDNFEQGAADVAATAPAPNDVVLAVAASGCTPYVLGALQAARAAGALTIGIANNPGSPLAAGAEIGITLDTGAEVIAGSTRLKAGTAHKIALNAFSSALMVGLNKVYGNLMVDMQPSNLKLRRRAIDMTMLATGADEAAARATLERCNYRTKVAVVMLKAGIDAAAAEARLAAAGGSVQRAIAARSAQRSAEGSRR